MERIYGPFEFFAKERWILYNFFSEVITPRLQMEDDIEEGMKVREPFSIDDLKVMFEGEDSIRLLSKKQGYPSRPWGLLIALYTGLRAEEIFSLLIDNVVVDGDPHFNIKVTKGHNRLKNKEQEGNTGKLFLGLGGRAFAIVNAIIDLFPVNRDIPWSVDADANLIAFYTQYSNSDFVSYHEGLAHPAG